MPLAAPNGCVHALNETNCLAAYLFAERLFLENIRNRRQFQLLIFKRFPQIVGGSEPDGLNNRLDLSYTGQNHNRYSRHDCLEMDQHVQTIHTRHNQVEKDEIRS